MKSFLLCNIKGCNRKYMTEKKWLLHMETEHPMDEPHLPDPVEVLSKEKRTNASLLESTKRLKEVKARKEVEEQVKKRLADEVGNELYENEKEMFEIRKRVMEGTKDCAICMDAAPDALPEPCNHAVFCYECLSTKLIGKPCPICRRTIERCTRIYL